jgi:hypothetical protein
MRRRAFAMIPLLTALWAPSSMVLAETLGDPRVGFSAERILILDGHSYVGKMWNMPGEQRHEQDLPAVKPVFLLHADSAIGEVVLPQLHTVVEFILPSELAVLGKPGLLGKPIGQEIVNGIATTRYAVDRDIPEGHAAGSLWLSSDGIPVKCDGRFEAKNGKVSTIHWELRHIRIGRQDAALFDVPPGYSRLPPEAAAQLLGLRLAPTPHAGPH